MTHPLALAATGQPTPWWVGPVLVAAAVVWLAGYLVACWIWPFRNCRKCDGTARVKSPSGKAFRRCRKCKATGRRLRFGRWAYNFVSNRRKEASR